MLDSDFAANPMLTIVRSRGIAVLGLLALLFGLAVWFGSLGPAPALGAYPDEENLGEEYSDYLGERVTVTGWVIATDPVVIRAEYGADEAIQLTITDLSITATEGDRLRVYDVVTPDQTIRANNACDGRDPESVPSLQADALPAQVLTQMVDGDDEPVRTTELQAEFDDADIDTSRISQTLAGLKRRGLVEAEPDPEDNRAKIYWPTEKGELALNE